MFFACTVKQKSKERRHGRSTPITWVVDLHGTRTRNSRGRQRTLVEAKSAVVTTNCLRVQNSTMLLNGEVLKQASGLPTPCASRRKPRQNKKAYLTNGRLEDTNSYAGFILQYEGRMRNEEVGPFLGQTDNRQLTTDAIKISLFSSWPHRILQTKIAKRRQLRNYLQV